MRKSRFTDRLIMAVLKQAEAGVKVPDLCREHGISSATFYYWRSEFGGMDTSMMKRLTELEDENRRLKKKYAEERLINVIDDYNREGLIIDADFSLPAERVIRSLEQLIEWRGKPQTIRCDNGPEYVSHKLTAWAKKQRIDINYIQPGKPQQSAYVERYNRTIRYDWLSHYLFESIAEVQDFATRWLWTYNNERPNMALGGITPKQKVAMAA
jgi:transposase InsO family protein